MASRNEATLSRLNPGIDPEWTIVVAFYAGLHWIDAFLAHYGVHPANHGERTTKVLSLIKPARRAYGFLRDHGAEARYETVTLPVSLALNCRDTWLPEVKQHTKLP